MFNIEHAYDDNIKRDYQKPYITGQTIQWPNVKGKKDNQTTIYKPLHRKLKIEQHEPH
jgi:hypothetical protein